MTSAKSPAADPIALEVVRNKLDGIANEMQSTLVRSSFSPIVKEGLDASASLFTLEGETLAQATAIPIHVATLIPVVRAVIEKFPVGAMREGDIYIMNDPYHGGTHLPDIALVMPIFSRGRPIAFSAAMTHHQDVGGMSPGSVPTNATEIYEEGIRIPPRERGRRRVRGFVHSPFSCQPSRRVHEPAPPPAGGPSSRPSPSAWLYGLVVFAAAWLVFWTQPLAVRGVLPVLGGSPAV